jgi:DNA-directed RNA polymerase subunit delta
MSKKDNLKRVIVDFKKLTPEILDLLVEKYPDGYDDSDIITFRNLKNEVVEAVEVRTDDTIYLVKVGTRLIQAMEDYGDDDSNDEEVDFEGVKAEDEEEDSQDEDSEDFDE